MASEEVFDDAKRPSVKKAQRARKMDALADDDNDDDKQPQARRARHGDGGGAEEKAPPIDDPEAVCLDILAPFVTPPPWLTDKYRIVDDDYGADDRGFDECGRNNCMSHPASWYSWPIPNSNPRRWFYTQLSWFEKANLPKKPHVQWVKEEDPEDQVGFEGTEFFVYKVLSPQGRAYVCKHMGAKEAMMSFIASVLDMSPRVYDIWHDEEENEVRLVMELMPDGSLYPEVEGYKHVNDPRSNRGFGALSAERWEAIWRAAVKTDNALQSFGLLHRDYGGRNQAWHKGRVFALDWGISELYPRAGTPPTPYMFQDIPLQERRRLAEIYMSDWAARSKSVSRQVRNRDLNIRCFQKYFQA